MKKQMLGLLLTIIVAFSVGASGYHQEDSGQGEGWKPYTPSRLEWLAVNYNALYRRNVLSTLGYTIQITPLHNIDTISIVVEYLPEAERSMMNGEIEYIKIMIKTEVERRGWASWLKIREDIRMLKEISQPPL